jgi:hypothetical protein
MEEVSNGFLVDEDLKSPSALRILAIDCAEEGREIDC